MKALQVRLPDSLHERLKELSKREGISLNQALVMAASNEIVRHESRELFTCAAGSYNAAAFAEALAAVPDAPLEGDELE